LPVLRVGTSGDYTPFSTRGADGVVRGFDAQLAEELAHDLGMRIEWSAFRWPTLQAQMEAGQFDVAMSGVTWQPTRGVVGYMSRAVAWGGPCVLGDPAARRVAVNRGGVLEAWAHDKLSDRDIVTVDDNQSLPGLLSSASVGAIVTDSFERHVFERPGWAVTCWPPLARKVYWVAPARARELGPRIDAWLRDNSSRVQAAQEQWFGERQRLDAVSALVDLLARRLAFMPLVGRLKQQQGLPVEDRARERAVLDKAVSAARQAGLPEQPVHELFALQIALSKAVERRKGENSTLDLTTQIRPALTELGDRIILALQEARESKQLEHCTLGELEPLSPWLELAERERLLERLQAVGR